MWIMSKLYQGIELVQDSSESFMSVPKSWQLLMSRSNQQTMECSYDCNGIAFYLYKFPHRNTIISRCLLYEFIKYFIWDKRYLILLPLLYRHAFSYYLKSLIQLFYDMEKP